VSVALSAERWCTSTLAEPKAAATSSISGESVDTTIREMLSHSSAALIAQCTSGLPAISLMFLSGIDLLPARTGMNAV